MAEFLLGTGIVITVVCVILIAAAIAIWLIENELGWYVVGIGLVIGIFMMIAGAAMGIPQ
jgi:hypothetical protein